VGVFDFSYLYENEGEGGGGGGRGGGSFIGVKERKKDLTRLDYCSLV
jgi:hypothetical protein